LFENFGATNFLFFIINPGWIFNGRFCPDAITVSVALRQSNETIGAMGLGILNIFFFLYKNPYIYTKILIPNAPKSQ
jgi:hypothetical protein